MLSFLTGMNCFDIFDHCILSKRTAVKLRNDLLKVIKEIVNKENDNVMLGSNELPVKIDES